MQDKRSRVLEVATQLFAEQGFDKTSVAHICELAQVSKGLVYHHFKSKDDILVEIFSATTQKMVEMNETKSQAPPRDQLVQLIETLFSQLKNDKLFYQLNLNLMFQPGTRALLDSQIKERAALLFGSVKSIFDQIDPVQSNKLSFIFIAEVDGVALDYLSVFEEYPLDEIKDHLIQKYQNFSPLNSKKS